MSEMVERVARAICAANESEVSGRQASPDDVPVSGRGAGQPLWKLYEPLARAAIAAMREPTEAMLKAGKVPTREISLGNGTTATGFGLWGGERSSWQAMIDKALKP